VKVLVAEDQLMWRERLMEFLPVWGYEVSFVENGAQAWEVLQRDPEIDILMTDWVMPEMDGVQLCRRVRSMDRPRYLPIILLTSRSGKGDLIHGLNSGADAFVVKPFEEAELLAQLQVVERILRLEERLDGQISDLRHAKSQLDRDLDDAAAIQRSLLPEAPPQIPGFVFAWFYRACRQVGGDMFNVFRLSDDHVGVYVLDVSGHGTSAALHSVSLSQVLNPLPVQGGILKRAGANGSAPVVASPCEVAAELNRRFPLVAQSGQYFTFLYGILQLSSLRFRYVRAGHPGPIAVSQGRARSHDEGGGVPIGVVDDAQYRNQEIQLAAGDSLLLFTYGLNEARNEQAEEFGIERILEVVSNSGSRGIRHAVKSLHQSLEEFRKLEPQRDDITILGLSVE
jgi:sigma-B regulation protein RsbU (phosphoserine phosphatase)